MSYRELVIFISVLFFSCSPRTQLALNSSYENTKATDTYVLIPNGALVDSHQIIENNIEYTVGVVNGRIKYVSTFDKDFTVGGLRINDLLPKSFSNRQWGYRPGWGYYIELDAGWYAGFDFKTKPTEESRIQWFFKYDF